MEENMSENQIKSLEFLQNIISRMANNSSNLKNIAIAIVAAIIGYYGNINNTNSVISNKPFVVIILILWILDSYYLKQERIFKYIYNYVKDHDNDCFNYNPTRNEIKEIIIKTNEKKLINDTNIISCFISFTEILYYVPLIICILYFVKC